MGTLRFVVAALVLVAGVAVAAAAPKAGAKVWVRTISARVMKMPKFIAPSAATISRGEEVTVVSVQGDWCEVTTTAGARGWLHQSNVQDTKVALATTAGHASGGASRQEVELAGRGFTEEVEKTYRERNPKLDFSHVDHLEKLVVAPEELVSFVRDGQLGSP